MNWLITGGCGFIGRSLIQNLLAEGGHSIRIVDNLSVGSREELELIAKFVETDGEAASFPPLASASVELIAGDILNEQLAMKAAQGMDIIVHLAANTGVAPSVAEPRMDCVTNVIGTLNYLEAARHNNVKRFVFASSGAPAGECEPPIHEELPPHPVSPYGASKLAGEGYCSAYYRSFGVETVCLRFSNVYGPLSSKKESVVAKFIKKGMACELLEIYGDGKQTRDFIYIDDLVRAVRLAGDIAGIGGETFQIAAATETTVGEIADRLTQLFRECDPDNSIQVSYQDPRLGDVKRNFSDTSKAKKRLGWQPEVLLDQGLKKTIDWFHRL